MKAWESIFLQSPVNNCWYDEDDLPQLNWKWPKETWFETRLDYVREHQSLRRVKFLPKPAHPEQRHEI